MEKTIIIQEREITPKDIEFIREMIKVNPSWDRTQFSKELAFLWNWRTANGQLKDMACRTFLLKLERRGYVIGSMPEYPPITFLVRLTLVISNSELALRSLMRSFMS
ncbi:hypothetical protein ES702_06868 [subsurface metagenome]